MKRLIRSLGVCAFLVLAVVLIACSDMKSAAGAGNDTGAEGSAGEAGQSVTTSALVLTYGNGGLLFVSDESGTYFPGLDNAEIIGIDGSTISADDLVAGNKVSVTGDGIMLESWPGQYPGISRVEVTDEGSPEDAEAYADLIAEIYTEPDPSEPPSASVAYTTELYATGTVALRLGYTWSWEENGETVCVVADSEAPEQVAREKLPTVEVEAPTEVTVSFDRRAKAAAVKRFTEADLEASGSTEAVAAEAETVEAAMDGGKVSFTVEPGYRYVMDISFAADISDTEEASDTALNTVTYVFLCP